VNHPFYHSSTVNTWRSHIKANTFTTHFYMFRVFMSGSLKDQSISALLSRRGTMVQYSDTSKNCLLKYLHINSLTLDNILDLNFGVLVKSGSRSSKNLAQMLLLCKPNVRKGISSAPRGGSNAAQPVAPASEATRQWKPAAQTPHGKRGYGGSPLPAR
jgi:hypothetical protein